MATLKGPLTLDQQIDHLENQGLLIDDIDLAKEALLNNTLYRLNYYFKKFENNSACPLKGLIFSDILSYYDFDQWLRIYALNLLVQIEISIRSQLAHFLALKYESGCFYQRHLFNNYYFTKVEEAFEKELERNRNDPIIKHHREKYDNLFPIFVIVQFLSFSKISLLYASLNEKDGNEFSQDYYQMLGRDYLQNWLHSLSSFRNLCAHHKPLYKRYYITPPSIGNLFDWDSSDNNSLFAFFLVIKRITKSGYWGKQLDYFENYYEEQLDSGTYLDLSGYGFPKNWRDILRVFGEQIPK